MSIELLIPILVSTITAGTAMLYAALGEILAERSGILNLGVEGMMLTGAVCGFIAAYATSNPWIGILAAAAAGGFLASVHAFLTVTLKANQVVCGLALTLFGTGLSGYLGKPYIGLIIQNPFKAVELPLLSKIPVFGQVLFNQDALVYISYLLVVILWLIVYRTRAGLYLRATGENPAAADSLGVNVFATRYIYVIAGGMLAGIGGAYLSLAVIPTWMENITAGQGWIAVALVIFATWNPLYAMVGSYLFGGIHAIGFYYQALNINISISSYFLNMLPYLFTIVVLILVSKKNIINRIGAPKALGFSYDREER